MRKEEKMLTIEEKINALVGKALYEEQKRKDIEKKLDKLIDITQRYYDFWLHGTALEPIYKSFIDDLEKLKEGNGSVVHPGKNTQFGKEK